MRNWKGNTLCSVHSGSFHSFTRSHLLYRPFSRRIFRFFQTINSLYVFLSCSRDFSLVNAIADSHLPPRAIAILENGEPKTLEFALTVAIYRFNGASRWRFSMAKIWPHIFPLREFDQINACNVREKSNKMPYRSESANLNDNSIIFFFSLFAWQSKS